MNVRSSTRATSLGSEAQWNELGFAVSRVNVPAATRLVGELGPLRSRTRRVQRSVSGRVSAATSRDPRAVGSTRAGVRCVAAARRAGSEPHRPRCRSATKVASGRRLRSSSPSPPDRVVHIGCSFAALVCAERRNSGASRRRAGNSDEVSGRHAQNFVDAVGVPDLRIEKEIDSEAVTWPRTGGTCSDSCEHALICRPRPHAEHVHARCDTRRVPVAASLPDPAVVVLVGPSGSGQVHLGGCSATGPARSSRPTPCARWSGTGPHDLEASVAAFGVLDAVLDARTARRLTCVVDTLGLDPVRRRGYLAAARRGRDCPRWRW